MYAHSDVNKPNTDSRAERVKKLYPLQPVLHLSRILFRRMSDFGFCVPVFVSKDPALTSADRDSACVHIRDRAIAGLCRCIWSMICRLCIGPQHIIDQSAFLSSKSLSLIGATEPTLSKSSAAHNNNLFCEQREHLERV